jgi:hypothetical protein
VASPNLTAVIGVGNILDVTQDAFGTGGANHTATYTISASANYVGFFVAYLGDSGGFGTYSAASAQTTIDMWWNAWGQYEDPDRPYRR